MKSKYRFALQLKKESKFIFLFDHAFKTFILKSCFIFLVILCFQPCLCPAQQAVEDSLNKIITLNASDADVAKAYSGLSYEYSRKDPAKARAYTNAAIAIAKKINDSKRLSTSYVQLVYWFHNAGKPDSSEYYLNLVKNLSTQAIESEKNALTTNYYTCAALYYKRTGDNQKAIPFFEKAIAIFIRMGDKESTAGQSLNLGNTYMNLGNYQKATEQHLKALRIFEELGNQERGVSFCYHSLSNSFTQLKQYKQALLYANKSIQIKTTLKDRLGLGTAQSGLGAIYQGLGDFDKALFHFNESLIIAREMKKLPEEQGNYFNIAKVYAAKENTKLAIDYFTQSKLLARQLHDSSSVAAIDAEIIALQNNTKSTVLAENKLKTTIQLFKEEGNLNRQVSGYKNMADFYTANKQFDKALEYNNKYYQAVDSIQNNDLQLQIRKMEEQYRVEKKEKEITLLKKDKELQQQKLQRRNLLTIGSAALALLALCGIWLLMNRNKLRQRMKELELRNQIAADLHDEVGSSLSSIHMLSQMATQPGNEATHTDILTRMSSNAKETMDKMGDIVWMIKPGETEGGLKQRMERFAYEICSSKNMEVAMQLDELEKAKLSMEQRKNIYLIFKEALNNAVKYSGTEKVEIISGTQNKQLMLLVKDYGKGFDTETTGKGNGLDNMKHRADELNGKLEITSEPEKGTSVKLIVPL
jgi:two-component system, NarL family, sensor histidine kinase UhpB